MWDTRTLQRVLVAVKIKYTQHFVMERNWDLKKNSTTVVCSLQKLKKRKICESMCKHIWAGPSGATTTQNTFIRDCSPPPPPPVPGPASRFGYRGSYSVPVPIRRRKQLGRRGRYYTLTSKVSNHTWSLFPPDPHLASAFTLLSCRHAGLWKRRKKRDNKTLSRAEDTHLDSSMIIVFVWSTSS